MKKKHVAEYVDWGFGFPVVLLDLTLVQVRGKWTPQIDYEVLAREVMRRLANLDGRLTGSQVKFIRLQLGLTLAQFAERLKLTHPAIIKWERTGQKVTGMAWSTEKDIRLWVAKLLEESNKKFADLYDKLESVSTSRAVRIELDVESMAA